MKMEWGAEFIGTVLLVFGALLALWRQRRIFDRTNPFGVEQFSSYWGKLGARMKDGLLFGASIGLLSAGLLILAIRHADSWGWVVLLPVYAFMLFLMFGI